MVSEASRGNEGGELREWGYPDVRDAERGFARAQTLDVDARSRVFTPAAVLALATGDLARPSP